MKLPYYRAGEPAPTTPCIVWQGARSSKGYGRRRRRPYRTMFVHRQTLADVYGEAALEGLQTIHLCHNNGCYRLDHLRVGTNAQNAAHSVADGLHAYGERNGQSKLTEEQVTEARRLWAAGKTLQRELAHRYGVTQSAMSRILNGNRWERIT